MKDGQKGPTKNHLTYLTKIMYKYLIHSVLPLNANDCINRYCFKSSFSYFIKCVKSCTHVEVAFAIDAEDDKAEFLTI
jgi:hypothetical protein